MASRLPLKKLALRLRICYNIPMEIITSASNKIVKYVKGLHGKKERTAEAAFLAEGAKILAEIKQPWEIQMVVASKTFAATHADDLEKYADQAKTPLHVVADQIFPGDAVTPQGLLAVVKQRTFGPQEAICGECPLVLVLEEISDPGNLGTMLRIAHGLGLGVVLSPNCADVFSPKVVRSSAGSLFHVPFTIMPVDKAAAFLKSHGIAIFAATAAASDALYHLDFRRPAAILIGNEARGISDKTLSLADYHVKIPAIAESLNASVACGILAYEATRQRLSN